MKTFVAALLTLLSTPALAQNKTILVAADSSSGTYATMLSELSEFCSDTSGPLVISQIKNSGGALGNLEALVNNKASVAFLHSDVIYASAQSDSKYREFKTLVALYPEDIHIIALRNSKTQTAGNMIGLGKKTIEFNDAGDLKGFKVAAAGGGCYTARILKGQGDANWEVVCKDSGKEVLPALDSGEVQAAIFVGGAPLPNIETLNAAQYKLLPIHEGMASKLTGVYKRTSISYTNLKSGNVATLAPQALIITRKYSVPTMLGLQAQFRKCFHEHLAELQETPGKHAKWSLVDSNDKGVWEWYELPAIPAKGKK